MSLVASRPAEGPNARQIAIGVGVAAGAVVLWMIFGIWPAWLDSLLQGKKAFVSAVLNGITLAGLYFLVASGFTLVFGLMRNVNLAHGSLYLLGAYVGYDFAHWTGNWYVGVLAGAVVLAAVGALMQVLVFQRLAGDELRQTLVTIGISVVAADLMLAVWGGKTYQFEIPSVLDGSVALPIVTAIKSNGQAVFLRFPLYRLVVLAASVVIGVLLWLGLNRTKIGMMIRAGVDDRVMLSVAAVNVKLLFVGVFAIGGALDGFSGVIGGSALSVAPGEDVRYLLASLVVVIVGGMGSITGAAVGALLIRLAEQLGLVYFPTYGVVLTFAIMVVVLALRPQGILGNARLRAADPPRPVGAAEIVTAEFKRQTAALAVAQIFLPAVASPFLIYQVGAQSLIPGLVGLSLMVLAGYGGMVSLAQLSVAGLAGYAVAILGPNGTGMLGLNWPYWLYVPAAILIAGVVNALIGLLAVRTAGIYTIMITLGGADGVNFLGQYQQAGGQAPLVGGSITVDRTVLGTQGKQRDYIIGTAAAGPIADNAEDAPWKKFVADYKAAYKDGFPSPSLFAQGYYINTKAVLLALDKINGDLSDGEKKLRETLSGLAFETPTGLVKLDKNRQAIADNYLTEVAKADDGHLYNKVIKVVHGVNQTLGIPEADFMKLGVANRDNPDCK